MIGFMPPTASLSARHRSGQEADRIEFGSTTPAAMVPEYVGRHRMPWAASIDMIAARAEARTPIGFQPTRRDA